MFNLGNLVIYMTRSQHCHPWIAWEASSVSGTFLCTEDHNSPWGTVRARWHRNHHQNQPVVTRCHKGSGMCGKTARYDIISMPAAQDNSPFSFGEHGCGATCNAICGSEANLMYSRVRTICMTSHIVTNMSYGTVHMVTYGSTWMNCFNGLACWCLRLSTKSLDRLYQSIVSLNLQLSWAMASQKCIYHAGLGGYLFKSKSFDSN